MPAPVALPDCPAPDRPALPLFDESLPVDAPANLEILLRRDDMYRRYAEALEETVKCQKDKPEGRDE